MNLISSYIKDVWNPTVGFIRNERVKISEACVSYDRWKTIPNDFWMTTSFLQHKGEKMKIKNKQSNKFGSITTKILIQSVERIKKPAQCDVYITDVARGLSQLSCPILVLVFFSVFRSKLKIISSFSLSPLNREFWVFQLYNSIQTRVSLCLCVVKSQIWVSAKKSTSSCNYFFCRKLLITD